MNRQLSRNFTLGEAMRSETALRLGIDNEPPYELIPALRAVALNILQPVRDHYGVPFSPSSWFRCLELNRAVGSKDTSQHPKGEAVDFNVPGHTPFEVAVWMMQNLPTWDQLILEFHDDDNPHSGWVHCSFTSPNKNRKEVLRIGKQGVRTGLIDEE